MTTFEQCQDEIAKNNGFDTWRDYYKMMMLEIKTTDSATQVWFENQEAIKLYAKKHAIEFARFQYKVDSFGNYEQLYERFLKEGK